MEGAMEYIFAVSIAIVAMFLVSIINGIRILWRHRQFRLAIQRCNRAGELFFEWEAARPFLFVGQSRYAQSLIIEMIEQYEYAGSLFAYISPDQDWIEAWREVLNEMPPDYDPTPRTARGFSFSGISGG